MVVDRSSLSEARRGSVNPGWSEHSQNLRRSNRAWFTQCQCSPFYQHTALYPLIDLLERIVLRFEPQDSSAQKLSKLEGFLVESGLPLADTIPLFSNLLAIPQTPNLPPPDTAPEQQKQQTMRALMTIPFRRAAQQPVVFIMEDLHWVDPTTLEWLDMLVDRHPHDAHHGGADLSPRLQPAVDRQFQCHPSGYQSLAER